MSQLQLLKQAYQHTEAMLQAAQNAQWNEVAEQHQKRETLFQSAFPITNASETEVAKLITEKILKLNQEIELLCKQARQQVQTELTGLHHNKKAVSAYQNT